jgi:hypothetical protein
MKSKVELSQPIETIENLAAFKRTLRITGLASSVHPSASFQKNDHDRFESFLWME